MQIICNQIDHNLHVLGWTLFWHKIRTRSYTNCLANRFYIFPSPSYIDTKKQHFSVYSPDDHHHYHPQYTGVQSNEVHGISTSRIKYIIQYQPGFIPFLFARAQDTIALLIFTPTHSQKNIKLYILLRDISVASHNTHRHSNKRALE